MLAGFTQVCPGFSIFRVHGYCPFKGDLGQLPGFNRSQRLPIYCQAVNRIIYRCGLTQRCFQPGNWFSVICLQPFSSLQVGARFFPIAQDQDQTEMIMGLPMVTCLKCARSAGRCQGNWFSLPINRLRSIAAIIEICTETPSSDSV